MTKSQYASAYQKQNVVVSAPTKNLPKILREKLHLSQEGFARLLGVSLKTISRWELQTAKPDSYLQERLVRLNVVVNKLSPSMQPGALMRWLTTSQSALRGYTPVDLLGSDYSTEQLQEFIEEWNHGAPT